MSVRILFFLGFAAGLSWAPAVPARAQTEASPFMPAGTAVAAAAPDGSSYELRGVMTTPQGTRFCIYDPATKTGTWVGLNEKGHSFVVNSADGAHNSVSIQAADGRRLMLAMREAKVMTSNEPNLQAVAQPQPQPGSGGGAPVGTVVLHPTPESEQARLQAITDEVRRRRLLREQAQNGQGAQPQAAAPPPAR